MSEENEGEDDVLLPPPASNQEEAPLTEGRDREKLAAEVELDPTSLSGSWFHRIENGEIVWDGIVVGEPQPGVYLLSVRRGLSHGDETKAQVAMPLTAMTAKDEGYEFRFYDTREQMFDAYAKYVVGSEVI
jgi:hypothetical protein